MYDLPQTLANPILADQMLFVKWTMATLSAPVHAAKLATLLSAVFQTVTAAQVTEESYRIAVLFYKKATIGWVTTSDGDPDLLWKRILIHISGGLNSILIFIKHFLFKLKISKTLVFFLRTPGEYSKKYRQGSVFSTDHCPCPYLVRYSFDVLKKKTKVLDTFNTDKICFMKIDIESSLPEIWIRIRFHNGSGSQSLIIIKFFSIFFLINTT